MVSQYFQTLCHNLQNKDALHIPSPPNYPRRGCVAAILRCRPSTSVEHHAPVDTVDAFLSLPWVEQAEPELLFIQRATRVGDPWSGHVAFPGGKNEPGETDIDTVIRETMEEIGLDLSSKAFIPLGKLDDRPLKRMNGKLLMMLVPFVFLQVVPDTPALTLQTSEVARTQWVPLRFFLSLDPFPNAFQKESLAPARRVGFIAPVARHIVGSVSLPAVHLPTDEPERIMCLWGLTLGMTRELMERTVASDGKPAWQQLPFVAMAASTPRFSSREIGWIMSLLMRLRQIVKEKRFPLHRLVLHNKEYERAYYRTLRYAVLISVVLRLSVGATLLVYVTRRLLR